MIDIKKAVRNLEERIKVQNKIIQTFDVGRMYPLGTIIDNYFVLDDVFQNVMTYRDLSGGFHRFYHYRNELEYLGRLK